jgi:cytochrome c oxidase subunit 2
MEVLVMAQPRADFDRWLRGEDAPARPPTGAEAQRGKQLFLTEGCADCHQIRGTPARGQVGPDLTHVASRTTLASGTIPNDRFHMMEWLSDPQLVKPGNKMPELQLSASDFSALVAYLEELK